MPLEANELTHRFGEKLAVDDVSFRFPEGAVVGLVGPNGAGKTTTIRLAMGLLVPSAGRVTWNGTPARDLDRTTIGYLPEQIGVYERMRVADHVVFRARLHGRDAATARRAAGEWCERLGLDPRAAVASLSKGNQQRVQLASTLAHDPSLVVLDEPSSGLDPIGQELVEEIMRDLAARGRTVVLSTHDLDRVDRFCDHVALMAKGRLLFDGSVEALRRRHSELRLLELRLAGPSADLQRQVPGLEPVDGDETVLTAPAEQHEPEELLRAALDAGASVRGLAVREPSMRELFRKEVEA